MNWKTTDPFLIYLFCQHTICSVSICLLTGPGTARRRLFFSASSMMSLPWTILSLSLSLFFSFPFFFAILLLKGSLCSLWYNRPCNSLSPQTRLWHLWYSPELVSILPFWQETICLHRPQINRNVPGLRCSSRLCTVHFVSNTTYMPYQKNTIRHEIFADDAQLNHSESPENYSDFVHFKIVSKILGCWWKKTNSNRIMTRL